MLRILERKRTEHTRLFAKNPDNEGQESHF
jgi:hypothetical protein